MRLTLELKRCKSKQPKPRLRLLPGFSDVREQARAALPTPQFMSLRKGRFRMASFSMTDTQQVKMTVAFTDKRGNPAPTPAGAQPPEWLVDNASLLSLSPDMDGMACVVASAGPLGTGTVSVKVSDASGAPLASGSIDVTVIGGAPTAVAVTPGTPTEQP